MKDVLRYIDFGEQVPSDFLSPMWEYARWNNITTPTLVRGILTKSTVTFANLEKWDKFIYIDKISPEREITRYYSPGGRGTVAYEAGTLIGCLFTPNFILKELRMNPEVITRSLMAIVVKILKKYDIQAGSSPWRQNALDLCCKTGDKWKKFGSFLGAGLGDCYTAGFFVSLDVNLDFMRGLYKMETDKFKAKGSPKDIGDVVGGLHEIKPDITNSVFDEIPELIAKRFDWELKEDILTQEEEKKWKALAEKLKSEEWIKYGRHPDIK